MLESEVQTVNLLRQLSHIKTKEKEREEAVLVHLCRMYMMSLQNEAMGQAKARRSCMFMKIGEDKSQAEVEIEHLKSNIDSCEREEINSLKYKLHIVSKELESYL
nr:hypothetical protein [Tanacetum cinerariifolium]